MSKLILSGQLKLISSSFFRDESDDPRIYAGKPTRSPDQTMNGFSVSHTVYGFMSNVATKNNIAKISCAMTVFKQTCLGLHWFVA